MPSGAFINNRFRAYFNKDKKASDDTEQYIETDKDKKTKKKCPVCDRGSINCSIGEI